MSPPVRKRGHYATSTGRASLKPRLVIAGTSASHSYTLAAPDHSGERLSAVVVAVLIFASTALSLYDLCLLLRFLER